LPGRLILGEKGIEVYGRETSHKEFARNDGPNQQSDSSANVRRRAAGRGEGERENLKEKPRLRKKP